MEQQVVHGGAPYLEPGVRARCTTGVLRAAAVLVLVPSAALACGVFHVEDEELHRRFSFYAASIRIVRNEGPDFEVARFNEGTITFNEKQRAAMSETAVTLGGETLVSIEGSRVDTGVQKYVLSFSAATPETKGYWFPGDLVVGVERGGKPWLSFVARSVCPAVQRDGNTRAVEQELTGRIATWLAWRDHLRPNPLPAHR
jgi:hypothetical protein